MSRILLGVRGGKLLKDIFKCRVEVSPGVAGGEKLTRTRLPSDSRPGEMNRAERMRLRVRKRAKAGPNKNAARWQVLARGELRNEPLLAWKDAQGYRRLLLLRREGFHRFATESSPDRDSFRWNAQREKVGRVCEEGKPPRPVLMRHHQ